MTEKTKSDFLSVARQKVGRTSFPVRPESRCDLVSRRGFVTAIAGAGAGAIGLRLGDAARSRVTTELGDERTPEGIVSIVETPIEDLMQEHALLERLLLVYEHGTPPAIARAAAIVRDYLEDHHERDEEQHVFPRLERVGVCVGLIATLRAQHEAGRQLTDQIIRDQDPRAIAAFVRMYRPHAARENTELFPAFRRALPQGEYDRLRDTLERSERARFGDDLFVTMRDRIVHLERESGIAELASFTPETP